MEEIIRCVSFVLLLLIYEDHSTNSLEKKKNVFVYRQRYVCNETRRIKLIFIEVCQVNVNSNL